MTEQPQVNIKKLPANPTPEDLYKYVYNREARRKHTNSKKEEIKRKLWNNYRQSLEEITKIQLDGGNQNGKEN